MARATFRLHRHAVAGLIGILGLAAAAIPSAVHASAEPAEAQAQLLVAWQPGTDQEAIDADIARIGGLAVDEVEPLGVKVVAVAATDAAAALVALRADAEVAYAEVDQAVAAAATTPTDPLWAGQWGPVRTRTTTVWDVTTGSPSVVIAILDSGVDATQPDLAGALVPGRDLVNNDNDPADDFGHGTAVAGVAGARADNGVGIAGYCRTCSIMPVKVLDEEGNGSLSTVAGGIIFAADNGAEVINLSLSAPAPSNTLNSAVSYARNKGALVVAANGNDGDAIPQYPASSPGVVGVGATNETDALYRFSSFGPWSELTAPGCHPAPRPGGTWADFCGTSSASPAVAGIAGLLFAAQPAATATDVERALLTTALGLTGGIAANGRVDAAGALAALTAPAPPTGATIPAAPSAVTATAANGSAVVSWVPPPSTGVTPLRGYRVTATPGGAVAQAGPGTTSVPVGGLVNGASYTFSVAALNGVGTGPPTSSLPPAISPRLPAVERLAGSSRIETAIALSRRAFPGAADVVVARSDAYADALAAAPLAGQLSAPLLLSTTATLPTAVSTEIRRLRATTAYLVGGETALSPEVEAGLRAAGVGTINRIAGVNRFDTARLLAEEVGGTSVYLTEGANDDPARGWPDAVAVSGLAAFEVKPILLATRDELPPETRAAMAALGATSATVVGGTAAVSVGVTTALGDPDGDGVVQVGVSRVGGATRWDTARLLADLALNGGAGVHRLWMATGVDWPDALAAGPAAARKAAVLLLLDGRDLANSPAASSWIGTQNRRFQEAVLVGGTTSVVAGVETAVTTLLR